MPKTKQPASKAKPAVAKKTAVKASAPSKTAVSISAKPAATRAAEVEANIGGSRPLTDLLNETDWYK